MNKKILNTVMGATLAVAASSVSALPLNAFSTIFEDDNLDRIIEVEWDVNGDQVIDAGEGINGILDVGDKLNSVIEIIKLVDENGALGDVVLGTGGVGELTGIAEIEVVSKIAVGTGFLLNFGPSATFEATYGAGAMVAFFEDASLDLDLTTCGSIAACEAAATNGSQFLIAGFDGDLDNEWYSLGSDNVGAASLAGGSTKLATFNYTMSVLVNNTGKEIFEQDISVECAIGIHACAGDSMVDLIGSGDVLGGKGLNNDYDVRSDFDYKLNVPEPGSLALLGAGLLAAGAMRRRNKKQA